MSTLNKIRDVPFKSCYEPEPFMHLRSGFSDESLTINDNVLTIQLEWQETSFFF